MIHAPADPRLEQRRLSAHEARAWPFGEARAVLERYARKPPSNGYILFETGYGPSGLPHIGTFGEVVRTSMVRHALSLLTPIESRLIAFSDDMDGLRKVPDNVPNREMLAQHLGKPLTAIPDPFGTHESFGRHNNARLRAFLDSFGFEYEFMSATDCYRSGLFDATLLRILQHFEEVTAVILPTLGEERRATYSPFLPVCPTTGRVLQVPVLAHDADAGTIAYRGEDGSTKETLVTGGRCKLQWKADWAMRWVALGVDYEMAGKDLIDSVRLSSQICRVIGGTPPVSFIYELFLDEAGEKISKSKGNGLSVEEWLTYAPQASLAYLMYQKPRTAKRLHFGVIPRMVDEYLGCLATYPQQTLAEQLENPVFHVHQGVPPEEHQFPTFSSLLNLATVCHTEDESVLWHFVSRYWPHLAPASSPIVADLVRRSIAYYHSFVKPRLAFRVPTEAERTALTDLADMIAALPPMADAEAIQTAVYEVGKRHACFAELKTWFRALYEILLGQEQGPRMGSFFALYGRKESLELLQQAIARTDVGGAFA